MMRISFEQTGHDVALEHGSGCVISPFSRWDPPFIPMIPPSVAAWASTVPHHLARKPTRFEPFDPVVAPAGGKTNPSCLEESRHCLFHPVSHVLNVADVWPVAHSVSGCMGYSLCEAVSKLQITMVDVYCLYHFRLHMYMIVYVVN